MNRNTRRRRKPTRNYQHFIPVLFTMLIVVMVTMMLSTAMREDEQEPASSQSPESQSSAPETSQSFESSQESSSEQEQSMSEQSAQHPAPSEPQTPSVDSSIPAGYEHLFVGGEDFELVLVSKKYVMPDEFPDLELMSVGSYQVHSMIYDPLTRMMSDAADAGLPLSLISGYRPLYRSQILYDNKVQELINSGYSAEDAAVEAARWVAPPGTSEHATGLAVDLVSVDYFTVLPDLLPEFAEFEEAKWLAANCADYGFILRYPEDDEPITGVVFEPWHFRYVGVETAKEIMALGVTLEEYLGVV